MPAYRLARVASVSRRASSETSPTGIVLAIEPMVNVGTEEVEVLEDRWTAVTADRRLSAHFEHTVAVTEDGPEILTRVPGGH